MSRLPVLMKRVVDKSSDALGQTRTYCLGIVYPPCQQGNALGLCLIRMPTDVCSPCFQICSKPCTA